jgi:hypothetical protein
MLLEEAKQVYWRLIVSLYWYCNYYTGTDLTYLISPDILTFRSYPRLT